MDKEVKKEVRNKIIKAKERSIKLFYKDDLKDIANKMNYKIPTWNKGV